MASSALRLLFGGVPDQKNCSDPCSAGSTIVSADHPNVFGSVCVQPIDPRQSVSGCAQLRITLPLNPGFIVRGELHARCKLGGLSAKVVKLIASEDAVEVTINVPDGTNLWHQVPVELQWICSSRFLPKVTFNIRGRG